MNRIGNKIKYLRNDKQLTQNQLANILNVTQDSISLWERGKRIPDTQYIYFLAKFFNVSSDYLLGLEDENENENNLNNNSKNFNNSGTFNNNGHFSM